MLNHAYRMIVATSVTIFYCDCTGSFTIGYGKLMCWMSQPLATFLFFALPLALAVNHLRTRRFFMLCTLII